MAIEKVNSPEPQGRVSYTKNSLLSTISQAAKEMSGVASLCTNFSGSKFGRIFSSNYYDGVKTTPTKDGLLVDVFINVYANYNVADVACKVQENINNILVSMADIKLKSVNVHILGVEFAKAE